MSRIYMGLILAIASGVAGCGGGDEKGGKQLPVVAAKGTLTAKDMDTKGLNLVFIPEEEGGNPGGKTNSWAKVEEGGTFQVSTYEQGDGAPVGKYKVFVTGGEGMMPGDDPRMQKIQPNFKEQNRTGWEVEITSDPEKNDFKLELN